MDSSLSLNPSSVHGGSKSKEKKGGGGGKRATKGKRADKYRPLIAPTPKPMKEEKCLIQKYLQPEHDELDKADWALLLDLCSSL